MKRIIKAITALITIGFIIYFAKSPLEKYFMRLKEASLPCQSPIAYSIGSYDERFGVSKDQFRKLTEEARMIWEAPINKQLFVYKPDGDLKINLIYDYRQEATVKLKKLGLVIGTDKKSYDDLKSKYENLKNTYDKDKTSFDIRVASFDRRQSIYQAEVSKWNSRGGAPTDVYDRLNQERNTLNKEVDEINQRQSEINNEVESINALVVVLNQLRNSLNITVDQFNEIGATRGEEFSEGDYKSGPEGRVIDVYQFNNNKELVRVLLHEMGHALGLEHSEDSQAIMYRLNQGSSEKLTSSDITALKNRCKIK